MTAGFNRDLKNATSLPMLDLTHIKPIKDAKVGSVLNTVYHFLSLEIGNLGFSLNPLLSVVKTGSKCSTSFGVHLGPFKKLKSYPLVFLPF